MSILPQVPLNRKQRRRLEALRKRDESKARAKRNSKGGKK
jgi:hypothetical protein